MSSASLKAAPAVASVRAWAFYVTAWRWHFYAGLFVLPFMLTLAVTGLIMLYANTFESRFGTRPAVTPDGESLPIEEQAALARAALPDATLFQYIAPPSADLAALFEFSQEGNSLIAAIDPWSGQNLGVHDVSDSWYGLASKIHGTLLIGDLGDRLLEIAAGMAIILIVTGAYVWWPRPRPGFRDGFLPHLRTSGRSFWKELHGGVGFALAIVILFFLVSGLAWTGIWGHHYVQAWSTFPAEKWDHLPVSDHTHASLDHDGHHDVPWALEQTPLPRSTSPAGKAVDLDQIAALARSIGFAGQFRIDLPREENGVFTISADSMSGDTQEPTGDRTVHVDQYSGAILAEVGFDDYSPPAKVMAAGTALHQGELGLWNMILNTIACLSVIFLCLSGILMWWLRRPLRTLRLAAPPRPQTMPSWKGGAFIVLLLSLAFPLTGLTLLVTLTLDRLLLSQLPFLKRAVS